jgi:hypothetical protein
MKQPKIIIIIPVIAVILGMMTATLPMAPTQVQASGNPCPPNDSCTCNSQSGVLTDTTNGQQVHDGCSNDNNGNPIN